MVNNRRSLGRGAKASVMGVWVCMVFVLAATAGSAQPEEMCSARRWVAAKFQHREESPVFESGLTVRAN